ncbi:MAG: FecR domain-containing protein [Vicinamibacterales bacterium]
MIAPSFRRCGLLLGVLALVLPLTAAAQSLPGIGRIKVATGRVSLIRSGQTVVPVVGDVVYESDVLHTDADGQLAVTLRDETRLSLGPGSDLNLAAFAYDPAAGRLSLVVRVARGILSYVSGRIAKLMPDAVRLETPTSVIGVRGTHALIRVQP